MSSIIPYVMMVTITTTTQKAVTNDWDGVGQWATVPSKNGPLTTEIAITNLETMDN